MLACIKKKLVLGLPAFFAPHLLANNTINGSYTQPFALCSLSQGTYPFVVCCGVLQSHKSCHLSLFPIFEITAHRKSGIFYQNCSDLLWVKIVPVIKKNFWNSRLKAKNLKSFWDHKNNLFKQWKVRTIFGNRMLF